MAEQKYYAYNISNEGSPVEEPDLDRLGRLDNQVRFEITTMLRDTNGASYHNDMYAPFMNQRQPAQDLATNQSNSTVQPAQKQDQGNTVQPAQDENNPLQPDVGVDDDDDDDDDPSFDGMDEETGYMSFAKHLRADMKKNKNAPDIENEGLFPALGNGNTRRDRTRRKSFGRRRNRREYSFSQTQDEFLEEVVAHNDNSVNVQAAQEEPTENWDTSNQNEHDAIETNATSGHQFGSTPSPTESWDNDENEAPSSVAGSSNYNGSFEQVATSQEEDGNRVWENGTTGNGPSVTDERSLENRILGSYDPLPSHGVSVAATIDDGNNNRLSGSKSSVSTTEGDYNGTRSSANGTMVDNGNKSCTNRSLGGGSSFTAIANDGDGRNLSQNRLGAAPTDNDSGGKRFALNGTSVTPDADFRYMSWRAAPKSSEDTSDSSSKTEKVTLSEFYKKCEEQNKITNASVPNLAQNYKESAVNGTLTANCEEKTPSTNGTSVPPGFGYMNWRGAPKSSEDTSDCSNKTEEMNLKNLRPKPKLTVLDFYRECEEQNKKAGVSVSNLALNLSRLSIGRGITRKPIKPLPTFGRNAVLSSILNKKQLGSKENCNPNSSPIVSEPRADKCSTVLSHSPTKPRNNSPVLSPPVFEPCADKCSTVLAKYLPNKPSNNSPIHSPPVFEPRADKCSTVLSEYSQPKPSNNSPGHSSPVFEPPTDKCNTIPSHSPTIPSNNSPIPLPVPSHSPTKPNNNSPVHSPVKKEVTSPPASSSFHHVQEWLKRSDSSQNSLKLKQMFPLYQDTRMMTDQEFYDFMTRDDEEYVEYDK